MLADDMGLGKTLQALWYLRRNRHALPALVTCPAAVKYHWEREARKVGLRAQVLEGKTAPAQGPAWGMPDVTIINPQILPAWLPYLETCGLRTAVLDECQMYQSTTTKSTKAAMLLCRDMTHVLALSGTPLLNRPKELWPTLHMVRPDLWPSFYEFAVNHCEPRRERWGWVYNGASDLDGLHQQLRRHVMVRRMKSDVMDQLPSKVRQVLPMDVPAKLQREYRKAETDIVAWLKANHGQLAADKALRALAITRIGHLLRLSARCKARAVVNWANDWLEANPGEKLLLFANHKKMLDVLERRVQCDLVRVDGGVTGRHRQAAIDKFCNDTTTRCMVANIVAAGTGVDGLQRVCNTAAFTELSWHPGRHRQAEDRIYRIGTTDTAWVYYLLAPDTLERDLCRIVQTKQQQNHHVLNGVASSDGLNISDQLLAALAKRAQK